MKRVLVAGTGHELSDTELLGASPNLHDHPTQRIAEWGIGVQAVHDLLVGGDWTLLGDGVNDLSDLLGARTCLADQRELRLLHLHELGPC